MTSAGSPSSTEIRHIVNIRLSSDLDETLRIPLEDDLRTLVAEHPHALAATLHRDLGRRPAAPVSATWLVCMDFASMTEFEAYLAHPRHVDFLKKHQASMEFITAIQVPLKDFV